MSKNTIGIESFWYKGVYYEYSYKHKKVHKFVQFGGEISIFDLNEKLETVMEELECPRIKLDYDADGKPMLVVSGWVEMLSKDYKMREKLRSEREKQKKQRKQISEKMTKGHLEHLKNCSFCRRGTGV